MKSTLAAFVAIFAFLAIACQDEIVVVEVPANTPTPQPTYTPFPTLEPLPTHTPYPTSTAYPTQTPLPAYTPYPTYTLYPTATPTPKPTFAPAPTVTRRPTNTPKPTSNSGWENTGDWYRDRDYEYNIGENLRAEGYNQDAHLVTLDAPPGSLLSQISLTLGCIGTHKVAYLTPYDSMPPGIDVYYIGVWNTAASEWEGQHHHYYNPTFTDDGSAIYIVNQAQIRQMLAVLRTVSQSRSQHETLSAGVYDDDGDSHLLSDFDVAGLQDALDYLPCF